MRLNKFPNIGVAAGEVSSLPAIGREFVTLDDEHEAQKIDISLRRLQTCIVPQYMNVEVF